MIHYGYTGDAPRFTYAYFYCHEEDLKGADICKNTEDTYAYTWDDLGIFWSNHYVVFCPKFFADSSPSLKNRTDYANGRPYVQTTMDEWFNTRTITLFHETYHWKNTVSVPKCYLEDEVYTPQEVVKLAKENEKDAHINAESWAQSAMAIYLQKTFGLNKPPTPASVRNPALSTRSRSLQSAPPGFVRPVSIDSQTFNPSGPNIIRLGDVGPLFVSKNT